MIVKLIDADALLQAMKKADEADPDLATCWSRGSVRRIIDRLPKVNAVELPCKVGDTYDLEQLQELMEERKNPKPLTIEELLQMPGEPVWIRKLDSDKAFWMLAYPDIVSNRLGYLEYRSYGIEWIAFRQKPKEV